MSNGQEFAKKSLINVNQAYSSHVDFSIETKNAFSPTAIIRLEQNGIVSEPVRAFLDTGAQPSVIPFTLFKELKPDVLPTAYTVIGIDGEPFTIKRKTIFKVRPWYSSERYLEEMFWILPEQCNWAPVMPCTQIDPSNYKNPTNIPVADPQFWVPRRVVVLLGVGFFARAVVSVIARNIDGTALMEMSIGVIIFGCQNGKFDDNSGQIMSAIEYSKEQQLDRQLERLWKQDEIEKITNWTEEQQLVEQHFMETHYRDNTGRFVVKIPLKKEYVDIGSSRAVALRRFMYLERKLDKDMEYKKNYVDMMNEMLR